MATTEAENLLIERIRLGDAAAWRDLIDSFEGRLLAFVASRLGDRSLAEDVVQETFIGFLTSLPNYDPSRALESYLFSIAAHKLTDQMRRSGRRPTLSLETGDASSGPGDLPDARPRASTIARSIERRRLEEDALVAALEELIAGWRRAGQWQRLQVAELLVVRGLPNKEIASQLNLSEQTVANQKFELITRLRNTLRRQGLSCDVFPELA
jgi:RNA polymerase sigma-70 factor (ECF subfamily)